MRVAAFLLFWLGAAAPAMAQACDVSVAAGDVFKATTEGGAPAVGWDVKRVEGEGNESDHFARPALSLKFALDEAGGVSGPETASVMISSYSDKDVGRAPPLRNMLVRARADGGEVLEWVPGGVEGEASLARELRRVWPRQLEIEIVGANGARESSASFDLSARTSVEAIAAAMRKTCFR